MQTANHLFPSSIIAFLIFAKNSLCAHEIVPNTDKVCNSPKIDGIPAEQTCISHDGLTRCWYTYVPEAAKSSSEPVPLVIDMHGYSKCVVDYATYSGWSKVAQSQGFVVIWPQGNMDADASNETCWSFGPCCCVERNGDAANIDDIDFLQQAIANTVVTLKEDAAIDTSRIYFAGHSAGCIMAQAMAALKSDLVAAVCCHASSNLAEPSMDYIPTPIHVVYGGQDKFVEFIITSAAVHWGSDPFLGAIKNIDFWGNLNGCLTNSSEIDSSNLFATYTRSDCLNGTKVEFVEVFDAGHYPFLGVKPNNRSDSPDAKTTLIDTTSLSWEFCRQFKSEVAPSLVDPVEYVSPDTFILPADHKVQGENNSMKKNASPLSFLSIFFVWLVMII